MKIFKLLFKLANLTLVFYISHLNAQELSGNLKIKSFPQEISVEIPDLQLSIDKTNYLYTFEGLPQGTYLTIFKSPDYYFTDSISIKNNAVSYLEVNMLLHKTNSFIEKVNKLPSIKLSGLSENEYVNSVMWNIDIFKSTQNQIELIFIAEIKNDWYLLGRNDSIIGSLLLDFIFDDSQCYEIVGQLVNITPGSISFDKNFNVSVEKYFQLALFNQLIETFHDKCLISGEIYFMSGNDILMYPPHEINFSVQL